MSRAPVHEQFEPFETADLRVDIAVIGAGVGGAYAAWRLKQRWPDKRIALFEYSNRVGGRLYTKTLPGMSHVHAEVGGMRFIPATQKMVNGLVEYLGLPTRDFPMGAPPPVGNSNNIMYLRRRLLRVRDLTDPARVPYLLNPTEQGMNPDQLQAYVMYSLYPNANSFTQQDWFNATAFDGEPLYTIGFWNLLYRMLSSEAYQFMYDAGGYYTNVANTNAVSSLPTDDFSASVQYRTLTHGYQQLPITLVDRFTRDEDGQFCPNYRLDSFGRREGRPYALKFIRTATGDDDRTVDAAPEEILRVQAESVILALPRRSLELVRWAGFTDDPWLRVHIPSVISQWAFKIFLAYPYPWWRQLGVQAGRSITDMPVRQIFYFRTEGEFGGPDPNNLNSLMMVSYNDLGSVPFWKALEEGEPFQGHPNPFVPQDQAPVPPHRHTITQQMVEAAQQQVKDVHGLIYVPEPYSAVYHDWSEDPYGAGWHGWKAGFKFWDIMKKMRHPVATENVYICGEAYSNNQGWVEGALQTTELMLEEHFDVPRPREWLPADYDLGP